MTKIVLDPGGLQRQFPDSVTVRVRLIVQVIEYREEDAVLVVGRMPNLKGLVETTEESDFLDVDIRPVLGDLKPEVTYSGTLVNIEGLFDGNDLSVFACFPLSVFTPQQLQTLVQMSTLADLP
ncbi:hypothetical protein G9P44_000230 [Scheffersomyces stipitis]|nr:hypothetical protein G9P44_000230 [Scheffersomyces stipitis]